MQNVPEELRAIEQRALNVGLGHTNEARGPGGHLPVRGGGYKLISGANWAMVAGEGARRCSREECFVVTPGRG